MTTTHASALFGVAFVSTVIATPIARWLGFKLGLVDNPDNYRKIHQRAIPLGGGIAIFIGFVLPLAALYFYNINENLLPAGAPQMIAMLVIGGSVSMLMGLADDLRNLKARWKVLFQMVAALLAYSGGFRIDAISTPLGNSVDVGYLSPFITILWFLVCMNALNLVDGLDGLSSGIGLIVTLTLLGVSIVAENSLGLALNACLSGALLGFLIFNFNPASIFLGDSGSMFIGFLVAAISLLTKNKAETATALLIPLMALGLPIYDMAVAIIRRWSRRSPISVADRRHIHHSLLSLGFTHREAVVVLYGVSIVLCLASVIMVLTRSQYSGLILALLLLALVLGTRVLGLLDLAELQNRLKQDRDEHQNRKQMTLAIEAVLQELTRATSIDAAWKELERAFMALNARQATLEYSKGNDCASLVWSSNDTSPLPSSPPENDQWVVTLEINYEGRALGALTVAQCCAPERMKLSALFLDRIRTATATCLHRLSPPAG